MYKVFVDSNIQNVIALYKDCSQNMSLTEGGKGGLENAENSLTNGGRGVRQMLTIADKAGEVLVTFHPSLEQI